MRQRTPSLLGTMIGAGVIAVALLWLVLLADMEDRGKRERTDAERQLQSLAQLGAMEMRSRFELIDMTLRDMRELWRRDPRRYAEVIHRQAASLDPQHPPQIDIIDSDAPPGIDQLTLHPPRADIKNQRWVVDFTRPVLDPQGRPMRTQIRLSMSTERLARSFPAIYRGDGSALTLLRDDDTVILRQIEPEDSSSVPFGPPVTGVTPQKYPIPAKLKAATQGIGQMQSRVHPHSRTYAWRHIERYPFILLISEPTTLLYRDFALYRTRYLVGGTLASVVLMLGAYWFGQWMSTRERARRQLQQSLRRMRRGNEKLLQSREALRRLSKHQTEVRELERKRIAAEVHDDLGQRLTVLRMDIALLPRSLPADVRPAVEGPVHHLLEGLDQVMQRVRGLARQLRPPGLDIGLASAVESLVEEFEYGLGIKIELTMDLPTDPPVSEAVATAIYRLLQEALTNVARHARAQHVDIELVTCREGLRLRVKDDGQGFSAAANSSGFGLSSLRERAHGLGGQCTIRSTPAEGTLVEAVLPLEPSIAQLPQSLTS